MSDVDDTPQNRPSTKPSTLPPKDGTPMVPKYKTLVGLLCLAAIHCGTAPAPEPAAVPSSCPPSPGSGRTLVGCGLAPRVALLGVDEQAIYTVDGSRTFSAVAKKTGQPTKLYHSQLFNYYMAHGTSQLPTTGFADDKVYLLDLVIQDGRSYGNIGFLEPRSPGSLSAAIRVDWQRSGSLVFADGYVYFQDGLTQAAITPLVRAPLGGGPSQVIYAGQGEPFAVRGGYLYFRDVYGSIRRAPVDGGTGNLILAKLPQASAASSATIYYRDLAVDDDYLYVPVPALGAGAPDTLQRYAVTGGDSGTIIASFPSTDEITLGPPTALVIDGAYLYFVAANGLNRIRLGGDGRPETLSSTKAPPVFDATSIYVAEQMGGEDAPLQGVIIRRPK